MAFQMNYTTQKDANYPESYWRLAWFQIDRNVRQGRIRFDCYFNAAARREDEQANVLECKHYLILEDEFASIFEVSEDIHEKMYEYAQAHKEGPPPEQGQPDSRVSFFATAILV